MRKIVAAILAGLLFASPSAAQTIRAGGLNVQDEGGTAARAGTFNFTGAGVSTSTSAGVTTITIGAGSPYTAIANFTDNVNPAVCGTIYAVTVTAKTLTLPAAPATQVACHVGIYVAISGYATIAAGAGDTYAGNEKITQGMDVTGILDLWYVQGATTWYSQAGPPLQIWNANGSYASGQIVVDSGTPTKFCMSRVADNTGNALTSTTHWICLGAASIPYSYIANGTDGELITWDSSGVAATVAAGTSGQVLTSNGAGAAPTFQDAASSIDYRGYGQIAQASAASCTLNASGILAAVANGTATAVVVDSSGRYCSYASAASADADAGQSTTNTTTRKGLSAEIEARVYVVDVTSIEVFVGFIAQTAGLSLPLDAATEGIGFAFDDSADTAFWQCVSNDGATSITKTDSTVAFTTNTFYNLRIDWTTAATPLFYINGTQVCASHTSDLPAVTTNLSYRAIAETEDGSAKTFGVGPVEARSY